jgi:hypothetical protein
LYPEPFHQRPALFKLTQRRTVYPDNILVFRDSFLQVFKDIFSALHPFFSLAIKQGGNVNTSFKENQEYIVEKDTQIAVFQIRDKSKRTL